MAITFGENAPFRCDIVGSFLRPDVLKQARADFEAGAIDANQLKTVEDIAIRDLVAKQKAAGLKVITDGEFRRSYWHLDFMWGLQGIERRASREGYQFHDEETTADTAVITGPVSGENHPFVEHFKFVNALSDENHVARQTIPAPIQTFAEVTLDRCDGQTEILRAVYPTDEALADAIAAAYRQVIADLYKAGCRNIQFDDCTWGMFCDPNYQAFIAQAGVKLEDQANEYLRLNNLALEGRPADLALTTHVCRGNYHSTWASRGGYAPIAPILFAHENVDAFYLEFDDERSGNFEPLQYVAEGKKVVLGLITTKSPRLEDKAAVIARIHEAEKYIPLDRLCLSPQCGFASCEIGNKLTDLEQWNKLKLVKEIAEEVWGK